MQNFSDLLSSAKKINNLNSQLKDLLPDNIKNIDLVKIENNIAFIIAPNPSVLQLVKTINILQYLQKIDKNILEIKLEIKN